MFAGARVGARLFSSHAALKLGSSLAGCMASGCLQGEPPWLLADSHSLSPRIEVLDRGTNSRRTWPEERWQLGGRVHEALPGDLIQISLDVLDPQQLGTRAGPAPIWLACPQLGYELCRHQQFNGGSDIDMEDADADGGRLPDQPRLQPEHLRPCAALGPETKSTCILGEGHQIPVKLANLHSPPQPDEWNALLNLPYLTIPILLVRGTENWTSRECAQTLHSWFEDRNVGTEHIGCRFELFDLNFAATWRVLDAMASNTSNLPSARDLIPPELLASPPYDDPDPQRLVWRRAEDSSGWLALSGPNLRWPAQTKIEIGVRAAAHRDSSYRFVPHRYLEFERDFAAATEAVFHADEVEPLDGSFLDKDSPINLDAKINDPDTELHRGSPDELWLETPPAGQSFLLYVVMNDDHGGQHVVATRIETVDE